LDALTHGVGQHAMQSNGGRQRAERGEHEHQQGGKALARQRVSHDFFGGGHAGHDKFRVYLPDRGSHRGQDRGGILLRAHHQRDTARGEVGVMHVEDRNGRFPQPVL